MCDTRRKPLLNPRSCVQRIHNGEMKERNYSSPEETLATLVGRSSCNAVINEYPNDSHVPDSKIHLYQRIYTMSVHVDPRRDETETAVFCQQVATPWRTWIANQEASGLTFRLHSSYLLLESKLNNAQLRQQGNLKGHARKPRQISLRKMRKITQSNQHGSGHSSQGSRAPSVRSQDAEEVLSTTSNASVL